MNGMLLYMSFFFDRERDFCITTILCGCTISTSKVYNSMIQTNKLTLEHSLKYTFILKKLTVTNMTMYLVFLLHE